MFFVFDTFFIKKAQQFVDYCEVSTEITHTNLGYLLLIFNYFCIMSESTLFFLVLISAGFSEGGITLLCILGGLIFLLLKRRNLLQENLNKDVDKLTLPKEIEQRKTYRIITVIVAGATIFSLAKELLFPKSITQQYFTIAMVIYGSFILVSTFFIVFEYFLCTAPTPPGIKDRKRQEKETRAMVPQKT